MPARGPGTALGRVRSLAETGSDSSVCIFQALRDKGQMVVAPALGQVTTGGKVSVAGAFRKGHFREVGWGVAGGCLAWWLFFF